MDLYINKCNSTVLTDEELDVVSDAVENLLFKEFFSEQDVNLVTMHTAWSGENDAAIWRILTARERDFLDYDAKDRFYMLLLRQFGKLNTELAKSAEELAPAAQIGALADSFRMGPESEVATMALACEIGVIYISFLSNNETQFDAGCIGLVGLMNIICRLVSKRCLPIGELLSELPKIPFYTCEEKDATIIDKTIERWFKSERESLKQWRLTLEAPQ